MLKIKTLLRSWACNLNRAEFVPKCKTDYVVDCRLHHGVLSKLFRSKQKLISKTWILLFDKITFFLVYIIRFSTFLWNAMSSVVVMPSKDSVDLQIWHSKRVHKIRRFTFRYLLHSPLKTLWNILTLFAGANLWCCWLTYPVLLSDRLFLSCHTICLAKVAQSSPLV